MSDTTITFDGTHTPAPAPCGCELRGSSAVLLCPLHAAAPKLLAACKSLASIEGHPKFMGSVFFECARDEAREAIRDVRGEQTPETATPEQPLVKTGPGGDFTREMRACQDCSSLYTVTPAYQNEQRCWLCLEKLQHQDTIDVDRDHGGKIDLRG